MQFPGITNNSSQSAFEKRETDVSDLSLAQNYLGD